MPKKTRSRLRRLRNPFQEYIDAIRVAWIGFTERFSYDWLRSQTDVDLVRRIWASEAPRFSHQAMWDTRRLIPSCDEAHATEMYQRTLDADRQLVDYFVQFTTVPLEIELRIQDNQRRLNATEELLVEDSLLLS